MPKITKLRLHLLIAEVMQEKTVASLFLDTVYI